jgi:hypothetical protein
MSPPLDASDKQNLLPCSVIAWKFNIRDIAVPLKIALSVRLFIEIEVLERGKEA